MIRILHSSDWHLGRTLHGYSLLEDQAFALDRLIELIVHVKPHALLISGDLFDRSLPPEEAVVLLNGFLGRVITELLVPVFIIPGNHDSAERLGFAASLLRDRQLIIFSRFEDIFRPVLLRGDDDVKAWIYGIPFADPLFIARAMNNDSIQTHEDVLRELCSTLRKQHIENFGADATSILLCHAFVTGAEISESEKELSVGGSSQVRAQVFSGFTYTALGHLHRPQTVSSCALEPGSQNHVRYSGSLLAYSKSEIGHRKSITEICIDKSGVVETRTHELMLRRQLRSIESSFEKALALAEMDPKKDDYMMVALLDEGAIFDAYSRPSHILPESSRSYQSAKRKNRCFTRRG